MNRFDAFPMCGTETELLLLECRLTELYDTVDKFVIVEAEVDHQDHPKPLNYLEQKDRYAQWADKIHYVVAETMPSLADDDWCWAREHAQREWIGKGLDDLDADDDDILLQSDLDEIPKPLAVRNVRPRGLEAVSFRQRGHFWAIDWDYPPGWSGTVAMRVGAIAKLARPSVGAFAVMRDKRNTDVTQIPNAGWHFSWLGQQEAARAKVSRFCHPEVAEKINWNPQRFYERGVHVDDIQMRPVDVDWTWPKWMQDKSNVPASWYRPR